MAAPVLGVAMGLVLAGRCWRRILPLLATVLMATAALMVVIDQVRFRYPRDSTWPTFFYQYHVTRVLAVPCPLPAALRGCGSPGLAGGIERAFRRELTMSSRRVAPSPRRLPSRTAVRSCCLDSGRSLLLRGRHASTEA